MIKRKPACQTVLQPLRESDFKAGVEAAAFEQEWARQLAALPGHRQAEILALPASLGARELAASAIEALEENGVAC